MNATHTTETVDTTTAEYFWHNALGYPAVPTTLELHLSQYHSCEDDAEAVGGMRNDFARLWGKRIDALGGRWTKRPTINSGHRFVDLPATMEGVALARELVAAEPSVAAGRRFTLIFRFDRGTMWRRRGYGDSAVYEQDGHSYVTESTRGFDGAVALLASQVAGDVNRGDLAHVDSIAGYAAAARVEALAAEARRKAEAKAEQVREAAPDMLALLRRVVAEQRARYEATNTTTVAGDTLDDIGALLRRIDKE